MWSHYADNHQGFCIEYDLEGLRADDPLRETLYPVIYSNAIYDLSPWAQTLVSQDRLEFNTELPILSVIHKFEGWSYEQEWRMVSVTSAPQPDRDSQVPRPTRIFLGSKAEATKTAGLLTICARKSIEVWQVRLAEDRFELLAVRPDL